MRCAQHGGGMPLGVSFKIDETARVVYLNKINQRVLCVSAVTEAAKASLCWRCERKASGQRCNRRAPSGTSRRAIMARRRTKRVPRVTAKGRPCVHTCLCIT